MSMVVATQAWSTEQLMVIARNSWIVLLIIVLVTLSILWPMIGGPDLLVWALLLIALAVAIAILAFHFAHAAPHDGQDTVPYARAHNLLVLMIGSIWGFGILLVRHDDLAATLYIFVLSGTALGAVSSQHSYLPSCLSSIWSSITPVAVFLFLGEVAGLPQAFGLLLLMFALTLSSIAAKMHGFMAQHENLTRSLKEKVVRLSETSREIDRARSAAEAANQAKSETLAQVSHDLRHPLHAIGLLANSLNDQKTLKERQHVVRQIDSAVGGLSRVFGLLLENERLESGQTQAFFSKVALNPLVKTVLAAVPMTENSPEIRYVPSHAAVETDPRLLSAMVLNLLDNARKYARNGRVLIGCRRREGLISIWVCDQGPGIPAHDLDRLFEPFNRLHPKDLSSGEGAGLGLAIAHKMAHLLGLDLRVMSRPGHGTTFVIEGLTPVDTPTEVQAVAGSAQSVPLSGLKINILDDDPERCARLSTLLSEWGCEVSFDAELNSGIVLLGTLSLHRLARLSRAAESHDNLSIISMAPDGAAETLPDKLKPYLETGRNLKPFQLRSLLQSIAMRLSSPPNLPHKGTHLPPKRRLETSPK
ncbi:Sensor kinase protein RcsC [Phaeobacter sp. CECT 5382]|uniref:sensor histidine kinase n=1 Tax=Phaeobacter sp. CECT 5382 TaxID=1712645 RepID=UPI0006DB8B42|nr:HAMP domain-containing sensor histidine kinase [Phaeobacter sp. CECT 5382]CUH89912.1 Sensor kinase protein RcsC [Phaeobacter sp. CECT 5382]